MKFNTQHSLVCVYTFIIGSILISCKFKKTNEIPLPTSEIIQDSISKIEKHLKILDDYGYGEFDIFNDIPHRLNDTINPSFSYLKISPQNPTLNKSKLIFEKKKSSFIEGSNNERILYEVSNASLLNEKISISFVNFSVNSLPECIEKKWIGYSDTIRSYISINDNKYYLNDLYWSSIKKSSERTNYAMEQSYLIKTPEKLFLLLFFAPLFPNTSRDNTHGVLFDVTTNTTKQVTLPIPLEYHSSLVFNDFNGDKKLDYAPINAKNSKIEFYSFDGAKFVNNSQFFVELKPKGKSMEGYYIDIKKSNWFK